jgi:hypothetical protein
VFLKNVAVCVRLPGVLKLFRLKAIEKQALSAHFLMQAGLPGAVAPGPAASNPGPRA